MMHKIISSTIMNRLTSVAEHALNLNVERETCLIRLFAYERGGNGTTLGKWSLFCEAPMSDGLGGKVLRKPDYIPKFAVL